MQEARIQDRLSILLRPVPARKNTRQRLKYSTFLAAALVSGLLTPLLAHAQAMPSGGQVVAGAADIANSGPTVTVTQTTDKAVIDWTHFSVGEGGTVSFNNGNGATLNRVTGGNLSSIDGLLSATGSVYLINPNGVVIGKSGVVRVGGDFVAATLDIGNANFMAGGDLTFEGPSLASVVNLGHVGALGGDVALVAANVRNDGTVVAPNGTLGLLAGNRILMRDAAVDDGRFLVLSGGAGTSATNTGIIEAAAAELRAEGGNVYALAGNTQGLIRATGVSSHDGRIFLSAGTGSVEVSGSALAATTANDGGRIDITGQTISVATDATLDVSGANHGGTIMAIADMASGQLDFHGTAVAKGDLSGGFVETSGRKVDFSGARIDTTGATSGTWLVDPDDLTVDASAAATIQTNLASTNVTLQTTATTASGPGNSTSGSGDIIINSDISWSSANTLTLDSYHSINVNANLTASGAGGVVLTTNNGGSGGDYYFAYGKSLSFTNTSGGGQSLNINSTAYTLLYSMSDVSTMNGSGGKFALAKALDASGTTYTSANPVTSFSSGGIFTGLGNTISNLTITRSASTVGLIGANSGTVRDIGLAGGSISGSGTVGSLVGNNSGTIANAWSSAAVSSTSTYAGGLTALNTGTIRNSFTTGSVTGSGNAYGGLVGRANTGSVITNTFSTSAVTNTSSYSGGLIGHLSGGTVSTSFATGNANAGGLIGQGTFVTNGYYDSGTTGRSDTGKGLAQTTSQLQGTLPTGFSSSIWGTGTGLYPYLKTFFPNGVTAISGTAYNSSNVAVSKSTIALYSGGNALGSARSGANGYYYIPVATGTAGTTAGVIQVLNGGSTVTGAAFSDTASPSSANVTGLNVTSGSFNTFTSATSYATFKTAASPASAFGSSYYTSLLSTLSSAAYTINASGSFSIDSTIDTTGALTFKALGGDLSIDTDITISGSNALTLDAYDNLYINANLTASGTNAVTLTTGNGGSGDYSFLNGKSLSFTNTAGAGQSLTINSQAYSLLYTQADLLGIDGGSGNYALANSLDLSGTTFTGSPINAMDGNFTGLGHTLSNLNINAAGTDYIGLIGTNTGTLRDIGITGGTISGNWYSGALAGENYGQIYNAYSSADMQVVYRSGGLVGVNRGLIQSSHATGSVTSTGDNGGVSDMGGLVGWNDSAGTINQSYATGTVTGTANSTGGLVGFNESGDIADSFATGGVFGNDFVGGLVGFSTGGSISRSYSTGYVSAVTHGGGLTGHANTTTIADSYWDTDSAGTSVGNAAGTPSGTPTGLTRSALQNGSLPTGFSSSVWAAASGLYPYLKSQFQTGMQSISGYTYDSAGSALPAATLAVYVNGAQVGGTTTASGADGYYYLMTTPGTVSGSTKIGITETTHNAGSVTGAAYSDAPTLTSGQVTGFNVTAGRLTYTTGDTSYSTLMTGAQTAFGSSRHGTLVTALDAATLKIAASGAFSLDQAISRSGSLLIQSGGNMTLASTGSVSSTASGTAVTLAADGSFINNSSAGASAVSAGNGRWLIYTQAHGDSTTAATSNSFGGLNGKNYYNNAFNFSTGVLASTPTSGNRFVTGYAPTLTVAADTKSVTYNGSTQTDTYSLSGYLTGDQSADSLTGSVTGLTTSSKNAGAYTLTAAGTLASDLNYTISYSSGTLTIDKAALTIAAGTDSKTYDTNTNSTGTVSVTGLLGSDTVTGKSQAFDSQNAGTRTLSVTGYTVSDGNSGGNYTVSTQTASGSIAKANLTIAAGTDSKTYDTNTTSTGAVSVTGLLGSDSVTGKSQAFDSQNAGTRTLSVAGYTLNDGNSGGNYDVSTQTASGSIAKANLTIAAGTDSKTYDTTTTSTGTVSVTGLLGSDTVTGKSQAFDSQNAGTRTLSVTGYTVSDGNSGGNYDVTTQTAAGTIAKANLTIAAGADSKTYDTTTTSTGTVSVTGLLGSDTVTGKSQAFDSQNAGTRTLSVAGYTLNDGNSGGNYDVTTQTAAGTISKANLTITAGTDSKTYDTNTTSTGTVSVTGLLGSDTVTGKSQAFDSKNAGSRTLSVTGYTLNDGNSGGNYDVSTQTASGSIAKANLTIAAGTDSKTYDTTTTSTGTVSVTGLLGSDTVTGKSQAFDSQNAGTRTLSVTGYTVSDGNSGGNYDVTTQTAAGSIAKANLTIAAGTDSKTYDTNTTSTGTVNVTGLLGSDTVTGKTQAFDSQHAGTHTLSVTGYTVSDGNSGGNYTVSTQTASGSIAKANLTIAAVTDSKTYDTTTNSSGTVSVTGLLGSDTVTGTTQSFDGKNAGSRTLTINGYTVNDGNSGGNYAVTTQTAAGTIAKAALTIAAAADSKTYDATTASAGTVSVAGLLGSDTVTGTTQAFDSQNAGTRTLSVTGYTVSDGNSGGNYTVAPQTASGEIARANLTLTASNDSKTYDATTASTGTVGIAGLKGSDTVTGTSQAFDSKNAGARTLSVTGYTVNDDNGGGNYTVATQIASGAIAKAALTAALTGSTAKTYDATLSATLTADNYVLTGLKGSDTVALNNPATGAYADANTSTGKTVTATGLALSGTDANNYTVNTSAAANIGTITARKLTLAADSLGKNVGATDPTLTYALSSGSLAGSDALSGNLSRATGEDPGTYDINQGSLAASNNYDVTFIKGAFTVTEVALQNDPVVNPVSSSATSSSQPVILTAPIGLSAPLDSTSNAGTSSDANSASSDASSDASGTTGTSDDGETDDAGSAALDGNSEAAGPSIRTAGQGETTCASGDACANTPYPTNQFISNAISFAGR